MSEKSGKQKATDIIPNVTPGEAKKSSDLTDVMSRLLKKESNLDSELAKMKETTKH